MTSMPEIISTKSAYKGRLLNVRIDCFRTLTGHTKSCELVEHPGSVSIVPIDCDDHVMLVRQYRPAIRETLLEIPAGTLELGEIPDVAAQRELREEIGMRANRLCAIGCYYLVPGYSSELMHVYVATDLSPDPLPQDEDEDIIVETIPFVELVAQVSSGELRDAKTVSAVMMLAYERGV